MFVIVKTRESFVLTLIKELKRLRIGLFSVVLLAVTALADESEQELETPDAAIESYDVESSRIVEPERLQARIDAGEAADVLTLTTEIIDEIEENRSRFDETLVQPLLIFGDANRKLGQYVEAVEAYGRARQISRLNHGLHSVKQVEAVHREAETYFEIGHIGNANESYEYIFSIYCQQYEPLSKELLPTIFMLADWYVVIYNVFAARGLYEYATQIVDKHLERTSPENIRALKGLADTYRLERFRPLNSLGPITPGMPALYWPDETLFQYHATLNDFDAGEDTLVELVKIELERPDSTTESIASAKLALADWFILFDQNERAVVIYQDIFETFSDVPDSDFLTREFGEPVPLFFPLSISPDPQPDQIEEQPVTAEVGFTIDIDETGRVNQVQLDFAEPQSEHVEDFKKTLKKAIYRPRFESNEPVPQERVQVRHTYVYFPKTD